MMEVQKPRETDIQQQRQPGDSLHGEDEEGDHGQASTLAAAFDVLQALSEGRVAGAARTEQTSLRSPCCWPRRFRQGFAGTHSNFCSVLCWKVSLEQ